jgi:hypothetical protein
MYVDTSSMWCTCPDLASYGTLFVLPSRSCNILPFIGIADSKIKSSSPTAAKALLPLLESAMFIDLPCTTLADLTSRNLALVPVVPEQLRTFSVFKNRDVVPSFSHENTAQ